MSFLDALSLWNRRRLQRRKFDKDRQTTPTYTQWAAVNERLTATQIAQLVQLAATCSERVSVLIVDVHGDAAGVRSTVEHLLAQTHKALEIVVVSTSAQAMVWAPALRALGGATSTLALACMPGESAGAALAHAFEASTGELVLKLHPGDQLPAYALTAWVRAFHTWPDAALIYADEDVLGVDGLRQDHWFKPDWNRLMFFVQDYASRAVMWRRPCVIESGGFCPAGGAEVYDLILRSIERVGGGCVQHIPLVLVHAKPVECPSDAMCSALSAHFARTGVNAQVTSAGRVRHVHFVLPVPQPKVSVVILTRDRPELLERCVAGIIRDTRYEPLEFVILDNGTQDPKALQALANLAKDPRVKVVRDDSPFNFSALNNRAVAHASGDFLCLLNNDIEIMGTNWLRDMMSVALQPGIGAVGARLWFPDGRLQHAGVTLGIGGAAGHPFRLQRRNEDHYHRRPHLMHEVSGVTAACLVTPKAVYAAVGGLDEEAFKVAFNDVDFCLKVSAAGLVIAYVPEAELIHHESVSRGYEDTEEKKQRFMVERQQLIDRWSKALARDPAYNPNLTVDHDNFGLAKVSRLTPAMWLGLQEDDAAQGDRRRASR